MKQWGNKKPFWRISFDENLYFKAFLESVVSLQGFFFFYFHSKKKKKKPRAADFGDRHLQSEGGK